ncbi:EamA family transporter [Edaphobacter acidisoli]|nr:EamA family transporter [Edaphobacter acidisoli]
MPGSPSSPNRTRTLISFVCIYFFWGSTFLAVRYGVEVLPPFVLVTLRFLIAALIVLGACVIFRKPVLPSRRELGMLVIIGILMLGLGNPGVAWSEQYISSGLASLLAATIPLYAALIEMLLPNDGGLPARGWLGIFIGFLGLSFLLWPGLRDSLHGDSRQIIAAGAALFGAFCWTCASVISRRTRFRIGGFAAAGWQLLFGGLFNLCVMLALGRYHHARWGVQAWSSVAYLVVFGSLTGFTAYIYLLDHVPVSKVATYAYVNPVIAVVLGAVILHERFVPVEYVGMGAVLLAVFLVTGANLKTGAVNVIDEDIAASGSV